MIATEAAGLSGAAVWRSLEERAGRRAGGIRGILEYAGGMTP
jgi:hypothetical protein